MKKIVAFQRTSLSELIADFENEGPSARGVIGIFYKPDGRASFRISGFDKEDDRFLVCGLLDWIKADLMNDVL